MNRALLSCAVVVSLVALAGCTALVSDEPATDELLEDALVGDHDAATVVGERTMITETDDGTTRVDERVRKRPPDRIRSEIVGGANEGTVTIRNGSTMWYYDAEADEAIRNEVPALETAVEGDVLEELRQEYEIEDGGTDTVAGREVRVVELEPRNESIERGIGIYVGDTRYVYPLETSELDGTPVGEQTIWIDEEYGYPLKQEFRLDLEDGGEMRTTIVYDEVRFDVEVDDDRFEPPEGAEIVESPYQEERFDDREAAARRAPFDLPDDPAPEGYDLERVTVTEFEGNVTVTEEYVDGDDSIWLSVSADGEPLVTDPDREGVGEVDARVEETYGTTFVGWECDGLALSVWSDSVGEETLLEVAEDVGCE